MRADFSTLKRLRARRDYMLVAGIVAKHYGVTVRRLVRQGAGRRGHPCGAANLLPARHVALYLANTLFEVDQRQLAGIVGRGRRDIRRNIHAVEELRDNADFDRRLAGLEAELKQSRVETVFSRDVAPDVAHDVIEGCAL